MLQFFRFVGNKFTLVSFLRQGMTKNLMVICTRFSVVKMQEAGLIERWKTVRWRPSGSCGGTGPSSSSQSLTLVDLGGIFGVVGVMSSIAVLFLAAECFVFRLIAKKSVKGARINGGSNIYQMHQMQRE